MKQYPRDSDNSRERLPEYNQNQSERQQQYRHHHLCQHIQPPRISPSSFCQDHQDGAISTPQPLINNIHIGQNERIYFQKFDDYVTSVLRSETNPASLHQFSHDFYHMSERQKNYMLEDVDDILNLSKVSIFQKTFVEDKSDEAEPAEDLINALNYLTSPVDIKQQNIQNKNAATFNEAIELIDTSTLSKLSNSKQMTNDAIEGESKSPTSPILQYHATGPPIQNYERFKKLKETVKRRNEKMRKQ